MTKDRELLEMAAKAAGLLIGFSEGTADEGRPYVWDGDYKKSRWWNPLTDDGDRYRLAKDLGMTIDFDTCTVGAKMPNGNWMWIGWSEKDLKGLHKTDADAILALAAEIGRQMP
jgi:hypothetical protein